MNIRTKNSLSGSDTGRIVALAKKLIALRTIPAHPSELIKALAIAVAPLRGFTVEHFTKNGVASVLVHNQTKRPKKFKVLLNAHLDVIPGKKGQHAPKEKGGKLYGVGAMDMKANAACMIMAFKDVARAVVYPLALQLTTDEEIGGFDGTLHQVKKGVRATFILAGEPTNFDIVHMTKGVLWLKVMMKGKTAHGAYPWRGENAIWKMNHFLERVYKRFPIPTKQAWVTTVNLSRIETGNDAYNKIPDDCTALLDIRFVPKDAKTVLRDIKKLLPKRSKMEIVANEPGSFIAKNDAFIATLEKVSRETLGKKLLSRGAQGSSDARHFTRVGGRGIEFGPIGDGIGSDDEWVDIKSLGKYHAILKKFLLALN